MTPEQSIILAGDGLSPLKHYPGGLEGLPTFEEIPTDEVIGKDDKGAPIFKKKVLPVEYFIKEIAKVGKWHHRGQLAADGSPRQFEFTSSNFDQAVENFNARRKAGITPWIPDYHVAAFDASINNGQVIGIERKGESLYGKMKFVGSAAIEKTKKNDVSVWLDDGDQVPVFDASGKKYNGFVLQHVALTPNSALPHLEPFTRIAASAEQSARDVPVYRYSASPQDGSPDMDPKTIQSLRDKFGWGKEIPDDQIPGKAAEKAIALSADVGTLTTQRDALTTERDKLKADVTAKDQQVLALSADAPKRPDDIVMGMYTDNVAAKRDTVIRKGLTEPGAKLVDELIFDTQGRFTPLALSACGPSRRPVAFVLWDTMEKIVDGFHGVVCNNPVSRGAEPATPLLLSADDKDKKPTLAEINEARKLHGLEPRTA